MDNHTSLRPLGIGILGVYVFLILLGVIEVILH